MERTPPTFNWRIRDLLHHLTLDTIRYATRGCALKFVVWQPVLDQAEKIDNPDISVV